MSNTGSMPSDDVRILDSRTPDERQRDFLPGMGKSWLMPFYDLFTRFAGVRRLHTATANLAGIAPGDRVLDVGCGTGNLTFTALRVQPGAIVTGLDPDGAALDRAGRKARRRRVPVTLVQGYADRLPSDDSSFDRIISALALHHVDADARPAFAREAFRTLRPGGTVTVADFAPGDDHDHGHDRNHDHDHDHEHGLGRWRRRADRNQGAGHHGADLVGLLRDAGFEDSKELDRVDHRFGTIVFVQATRPGA